MEKRNMAKIDQSDRAYRRHEQSHHEQTELPPLPDLVDPREQRRKSDGDRETQRQELGGGKRCAEREHDARILATRKLNGIYGHKIKRDSKKNGRKQRSRQRTCGLDRCETNNQ